MGEATPNIYSARPRGVDVVAAGVAIVIDVPCNVIQDFRLSSETSRLKMKLTQLKGCITCRCSSSLTPGLVLELNQSGKIQAYGVVQPSSVVFPGSNK
ncbi:hypothetical protein Y032_0211g2180 [Ancylostoma ceylanicum]|uniref:Uncharacterized protein n=1 Tax=Ancylostoma ceylanicum TaxID=53326 RepID=A0A016SL07_9BILA|nr:hypothetical protein Y032_0211g2180 [Ancylostoma ceylanicum]